MPIIRTFKKRWVRLLFFLVIVVAIAAYAILSTVSLDYTERFQNFVREGKGNLYGSLTIERASVTLLPRPTLKLENAKLTTEKNEFIDAETVKVDFLLIPLLAKKYRITTVTFEGADILFKRRADGVYNFQRIIRERLLDIKIKSATAKNSRLTLIDEKPVETLSHEFTRLNATLRPTNAGFTYRAIGHTHPSATISIKGEATVEEGEWRFSGDFSAENLDAELARPYFKKRFTELDVEGRMDLDLSFAVDKGATIRGEMMYRDVILTMPWAYEKPIYSKKGASNIHISLEEKSAFHVSARNAVFSLDGFDINGSLELRGPRDDIGFELKLKTPYIDYYAFRDLFPLGKFREKFVERAEAFNVKGGMIEAEKIELTARAGDFKKRGGLLANAERLNVTLKMKGFSFNYTGFKERYTDVSGKVRLSGTTLTFENFTGLYGKATLEAVNGEIKGLGTGSSSYDIALEGHFLAQDSLESLKEFSKALKPVHGSGPIGLKIRFTGRGEKRTHSGSFSFKETDVLRHESLPLTFNRITGRVDFKPNSVVLRDIKGSVAGSKVSVNGEIQTKNGALHYELSGDGELSARAASSLLKDRDFEMPTFDLPIAFSGWLRGSPGSFGIDSTLSLTRTGLTYKRLIAKKRGVPMVVKSSFETKDGKTVIKKAEVGFGSSMVRVNGSFSLRPPVYELEIPKASLKVKDLAAILSKLKEEGASGSVTLSLKATREAGGKETMVDGSVVMREGGVITPYLKSPLKDVSLSAVFKGNSCDIEIENAASGKSSLRGTLSITDLARGWAEFDLHVPFLDLDNLFSSEDRGFFESRRKPYLLGSGKLTASKGTIMKQPFEALTADISASSERVLLDPLILTTNGGIASGKAAYLRGQDEELLYRTEIRLAGLDVEPLLQRFGLEDRILSGKFDGELELSRRRGETSRRGLNGKLALTARDGKLWRFVVISKIFSIVNILSISDLFEKGLGYHSIDASFDIEKGVLKTEDLFFESDSLRMSAVGEVDTEEKKIDMTLGVHPFVTVDKIISNIPLAGWIIGGEEKSAINMYYSLKGDIYDPNVAPQPVKTIGKKIIGIMERTLSAPMRVVEPAIEGLSGDEGAEEDPEETPEGESP